MAEEVFRIEIPVEAIDNTEPALGQAEKKVSKFERGMKRTKEIMNKLNGITVKLLISAIDKASGVIAGISGKVKGLVGKSYHITVRVLDLATRPLRAIGRFATSAIGMMTAGAGIAGGIVIPMKIQGDYEQTQIAFETMLKSGERATKFLEDAADFADKTPFEFPELINSSKLLMAFGFEAENVLGLMRTIGDTSSGLGAGSEGIDRITRALGQMRAKGRAQAEEMLQLQELGVPAAQILQEELGLTAAQVADIGKEGIAAGKVIDALLRGMDKRFGGMMDKQATTAMGLISTISDTIKNKLLRRWGEGLWGGFKPGLTQIVDWLDDNSAKVKEWGEDFRKVGEGISKWIVSRLDTVKSRIGSLTGSTEWKNATTMSEKMKIAWDKVIAEPFQEWWDGPGKSKVTGIAEDMGRGFGGALGGFIMAAFGVATEPDDLIQQSPFISAGTTAGKAFLDSFMEAFNVEKIAAKAAEAFTSAQGNLKGFVPGGQGPDFASYATLAMDAFLLFKAGKGAAKLFKGGKSVVSGGKSVFNAFKGAKGAEAAAGAVDDAADIAKTATRTVKNVPTGAKAATGSKAAEAVQTTATKAPGLFDRITGWFFKTPSKAPIPAPAQPTATVTPGYKPAGADFWKDVKLKSVEQRKTIVEMANAGNLSKYDDAVTAFGGAKAPGMIQRAGSFVKDMNPFKGGARTETKVAGEVAEAAGKLGKFGGMLGKVKFIPVLGTALGILGSATTVAAAAPEQRGRETAGEAGSWIGSIAAGAAAGAAGGAVGGSIVPGAGTAIGTAVGGILGGIGGAIGGEKFTEWLYDQKDAATAWAADVGKIFGDAWTGVKQGASDVGQWIGAKFSDAKDWVSNTWGGLKQGASDAATWIGDRFTDASNWTTTAWSTVSGWFSDNIITPIKDNSINTVNTLAGAADIAREGVTMALAPIGAWINTNVWEPVKDGAAAVGQWISNKFTEANTWVINKWSTFTNWFGASVWTPIQNAATAAGKWINGRFTEAKSWVCGAWSDFSGWFGASVWTPVQNGASAAGLWISNRFTDAKTWASDSWAGFAGWFDEVVLSPVKSGAEVAGTWINDKWTNAKNTVTEAWTGFDAWFEDTVWKPVKGGAERAANWISDKFTDAKEWIASLWNGAAGTVSVAVETARTRGEGITGMNPTKHAVGGIMTRPHMGLVAEAGPEAIIPLSEGKRQRGLDLWEKTGRFLGVLPYANGGIVGHTQEHGTTRTVEVPTSVPVPTYIPTSSSNKKPVSVKIDVSANPKFEIKSAAGDKEILSVIRQYQSKIVDEFSDQIAEKLVAIFNNMPEVEGA
ncbi:tape measure protein [Petroclostridium sp. X23]|uniref:tape measure protein n=1 Tax=Petroclostridium sp. X23 TaxID=3045146 RepID=UPI0024AE03F2|nr:tape measure protein [Petroclostridium sp. X23]WHH58313.1 tape measure protein [Petroclostridium sp. X23]